MSFPAPKLYYSMNISDVNLNKQLINWAPVPPVYDANIGTSYISNMNYKVGIGSVEFPKNIASFGTRTTITTPSSITSFVGISVSQDQLRIIICGFNSNIYYATRTSTSNAWSSFTTITGTTSAKYYRCGLTSNGTRGVTCIFGGLVYYFTWPSGQAAPNTLTVTLDTTARNYYGIAITPDGSMIVASTDTNIFFASWNGSNYGVFTQTLNTVTLTSTQAKGSYFIGIGISSTGDRIAYGAFNNSSNSNSWYLSFWNGTNYNDSKSIVSLSDSATLNTRSVYFSIDSSIIFLSYVGNSGASVVYGKYNDSINNYDNFAIIPSATIPFSLDTHGLYYVDGN